MKIPTFIFLAALMIVCSSCELLFPKTEEPKTELEKLPPITQEGKNTFGCLVNGKALFNTNSMQLHAIYQGGGLQFGSGREDNSIDRDVNFVLLDPIYTDQEYSLTNLPFYRAMFRSTAGLNACWYEYDDTFEGKLTFSKIDRINYIISGTFEFSTVTQGCDTIRISDGRFDMQFTP
jgi:hypothetical protein